MEKNIIYLATTILLITSGCANKQISEPSISVYEKMIFEERKRTNEVLVKAALLSSKSLAVYTRTKQALQQKTLTSEQIRIARWQDQYIPVNMEQKESFSWDSAPEPIMRSLASIAGYELDFINQRPPISRSVTVDPQFRMIRDFFYIIEQQTNGYIEKINIDDKSDRKLITVYYADF
jgi:hypothetical protein